jgi:hypothetical protein
MSAMLKIPFGFKQSPSGEALAHPIHRAEDWSGH